MVILKKIRAATLIETLTASVLIIIVFLIASLSFNNIFTNHIKRDHSALDNRFKELEYLYIHEKIKIPYVEYFGVWEIQMISEKEGAILIANKDGEVYQKQIDYIW